MKEKRRELVKAATKCMHTYEFIMSALILSLVSVSAAFFMCNIEGSAQASEASVIESTVTPPTPSNVAGVWVATGDLVYLCSDSGPGEIEEANSIYIVIITQSGSQVTMRFANLMDLSRQFTISCSETGNACVRSGVIAYTPQNFIIDIKPLNFVVRAKNMNYMTGSITFVERATDTSATCTLSDSIKMLRLLSSLPSTIMEPINSGTASSISPTNNSYSYTKPATILPIPGEVYGPDYSASQHCYGDMKWCPSTTGPEGTGQCVTSMVNDTNYPNQPPVSWNCAYPCGFENCPE